MCVYACVCVSVCVFVCKCVCVDPCLPLSTLVNLDTEIYALTSSQLTEISFISPKTPGRSVCGVWCVCVCVRACVWVHVCGCVLWELADAGGIGIKSTVSLEAAVVADSPYTRI